jgi:hypothetical protein
MLLNSIPNNEASAAEIDNMINYFRDKAKADAAESLMRKSRKPSPGQPGVFNGFYLSRYVFDVGSITFGQRKTFSFKIQNIIPLSFNFDIYSKSLQNTGFTINPASVQNFPAGSEFELEITFDPDTRTQTLIGDVEYDIPIVFSEDIGILVTLKANLEMSLIVLSKTIFSFGAVIAGQTLISTVQLQNMNKVPAWFKF